MIAGHGHGTTARRSQAVEYIRGRVTNERSDGTPRTFLGDGVKGEGIVTTRQFVSKHYLIAVRCPQGKGRSQNVVNQLTDGHQGWLDLAVLLYAHQYSLIG